MRRIADGTVRVWGVLAAAALILVAWGTLTLARAAEPAFPELTGRIVDAAGLLSVEDERALAADLEALEAKSTDQFVVVTLPSLQGFPIEDFANQLFRAWGIGQKAKDNGVLLLVAPKERKVRIEVGYGLEGTLPDAMAKLIIENAILPLFRAGDFPGGIKAGVRDIIAVLTGDAEAVKQRARQSESGTDYVAIIILIVWIAIFGFVIWSIIQSARHGVKGGRGKKGSGWVFGPGSASPSSWSGGGGFSGGGGSSGGGGASGGW